jgi:chromosome segregation ATPase
MWGPKPMDDIAELERRILYAMERVRAGLDRLAEGAAARTELFPGTNGTAEMAILRADLEAEQAANAQLTERVRAIKDRQESVIGGLEDRVAHLTSSLEAQGAELQRQRRLNGDLTAANQRLSDAARANLSDPALLNSAMATELEALRAARQAEMAEMEEILAELKPLIGEVA